ncbi:ATP-dependent nuclease [Pontibacillus yanchengensis]|uniref:ATP-dependent nuclease n=1 Tax=Pontibacillus yanchengensis TaxID=462910 RepID=UPI0013693754|nr:AAA family ATPase [Pontibacillus yanchengensis]
MKITEIKINNFRSIDEAAIRFTEDLMCTVGRNDVGKSNLIKAIETFFSKRSFELSDFPFDSQEGVETEICIHFEDHFNLPEEFKLENKAIFKITYKNISSKITKYIECLKEFIPPEEEELNGYNNIKNIGKSLDVEFPKTKPSDPEEVKKLETRVRNVIEELKGTNVWIDITKKWSEVEEYFPEVITVPAAQDPENEQKMTSDSSAFGSLFRVGIRKLLQQDEEGVQAITFLEEKMKNVNESILNIVEEKLLSQGNTFNLSQQASPLDISKSFSFEMNIEDEHGVKTPLSQRGNGLQRSVLMAIIRAQSDINKKISNPTETQEHLGNTDKYLYLIEEPEAFLHLSAQRDLYYSIKELISDGSQALITTHSTLFMDEGDLDQVVLLLREEGKTSTTQALDIEDVKEDLGEVVQVSQLMTGKVCCLVEGIADVNALKVWFSKLGYNHKELGIYFVDMKGCQNAEYYANVKVIKDFNVNFLILLDTDFHSSERVNTLKSSLINEFNVNENHIFILEKGEIENYFSIDKVEKVLNLNQNSIDEEEYRYDPKLAINNAKNISEEGARKYKEKRDSTKIAKSMEKEEIDHEIVQFINQLVKASGGEVIEG